LGKSIGILLERLRKGKVDSLQLVLQSKVPRDEADGKADKRAFLREALVTPSRPTQQLAGDFGTNNFRR
jgi:hypothetical protein